MDSVIQQSRMARFALLAILLVAFALRVVAFRDIPGGIQHDEVTEALHAQQVLAGQHALYFYLPGFHGREPLMAYLQALWLGLVGQNLWGLRFLSTASGVLTVALVYVLGHRLLDGQAGMLAAATTAFAFWPLVISRLGLRGALVPPLAALAVYLFWRCYTGQCAAKGWTGAALVVALACYTYIAGWALPCVMLVFAGYLAWQDRSRFQLQRGHIAGYGAITALALVPLVFAITRRPEGSERISQLSSLLGPAASGDLGPLAANILSVLGTFVVRGDQFGLYNIPLRPILPLGLGLLFALGVVLSLYRWRQPPHALLLIWTLVGLLPAGLAVGGPNNLRSVVSLPPTYLLVGLGAQLLIQGVRRAGVRSRWPGLVLLVAVLAWSAVTDLGDFSQRWPVHPDTRYFFRSSLLAAARALPDHGRNCISTPYLNDLSQWVVAWDRGDQQETGDICWFRGTSGLVIPAGPAPVRWYVPAAISPDAYLAAQANADLDPGLARLLEGFVSEQEVAFADGTPAYRVYEAAQPAALQARVLESTRTGGFGWSAQDVTQPQALDAPVALDGGLSLAGVTYQPIEPGAQVLDIWLTWQVDASRAEPAPLSVFVQLLDADGGYVAGQDHLDYAPDSWRAGDLFVQRHRLELPADLPAGVYYPQTGVYNWQDNTRWQVEVAGQAVDDRILLPPVAISGSG
jgi:4-amino-4-deoxy-L-arabinose transferase-like glycosyltransferase